MGVAVAIAVPIADYGLPVSSYNVTNTISRDLTNGLEPVSST